MRLNKAKFIGFIVFIMSFILVSPINQLIGLNSTLFFLFLSIVYFFSFNRQSKPLNKTWLILCITLSLLLSFSILLTNSTENYLSSFSFILSLLIAKNLSRLEQDAFINYSTKFIYILLVGAYIGLFWKILGGNELLNFPNPDGRLNSIFPFTLSNSVYSNLIRPSGIYDEPGAFSFFICSLAVIRDIFGKNKRQTLLLLILGIVTFSVAHTIFLLVYLIQFLKSKKQFGLILIASATLLFSSQFIDKNSMIYNVFLIRFTIDSNGKIHGDNRTNNLIEAYNILKENPRFIISGKKKSKSVFVNETEYGANPLGFILNYGLLLSIPYLIVIAVFLLSILKGKVYTSVLGFGLLLMQRDYLYVVSYSTVTAIILICYLHISNTNEKTNDITFCNK